MNIRLIALMSLCTLLVHHATYTMNDSLDTNNSKKTSRKTKVKKRKKHSIKVDPDIDANTNQHQSAVFNDLDADFDFDGVNVEMATAHYVESLEQAPTQDADSKSLSPRSSKRQAHEDSHEYIEYLDQKPSQDSDSESLSPRPSKRQTHEDAHETVSPQQTPQLKKTSSFPFKLMAGLGGTGIAFFAGHELYSRMSEKVRNQPIDEDYVDEEELAA